MKSNKPLISVLMSVYNTPVSYLTESIQSILNQTFHDFEFLIIDDGSDNSDTIECLGYFAGVDSGCGPVRVKESDYKDNQSVDNRIRLIRNRENLGLTKSLNGGLALCQGIYIARMDADDVAMPKRLETQLRYMEEHPEVALVGSEIIVFGEGIVECDRSKQYDRMMDPEIYRVHSLIQHSGPPHPTFFLRADFLNRNHIFYREDIRKAQDYALMANVMMAGGNIRKIREPLLKYRMHAGQITSTSEITQKAYQSRVSYDYLHFLFPELNSEEATVITVLGNRIPFDVFLSTVEKDSLLLEVCRNLVEHREALCRPEPYIHAIKKVLKLNKEKKYYDQGVFGRELRAECWERELRDAIKDNKQLCFHPFAIEAYFDSRKIRKERQRGHGKVFGNHSGS